MAYGNMTIHKSPHDLVSYPSVETALAARSRMDLAPCVALIGCDGSGKSTLARDLVARLDRQAPTRSIYLGLGTGDLGRRIAAVPVVGRLIAGFLSGKAKTAHDGPDKRLPGLGTALVMLGFSLARYRRFRKTLAYRRRGIQMVTDRYPQAEVAGSFDGPGLSWTRKGSALVERLARYEHGLYEKMAGHHPTVAIRLNVDVETALARKADHQREMLEKKLTVVPALRLDGARIVDIDANRSYEDVLETVMAVLRRHGLGN